MNWLNLNVHTLDSENFLGSEPIDRATWLCLLRYCIGQENSGRIANGIEWADRKWQQLVRITKKEVSRECDLWKWEGSDLVVWGYPSEKEDEIQQKRERAKTNGEKGGRPKKTNVGTNGKPTLVISVKAEGEGKEKGKEGEEEAPVADDEFSETDPPGIAPTLKRFTAACARHSVPPWYAEKKWEVWNAKDWCSGRTPVKWASVCALVARDFVNDGRPMSEPGPGTPIGRAAPVKAIRSAADHQAAMEAKAGG